ncbi:MAG: histidine kinase [Actinomycetota bacterium]|nr:histidine kinase [Actinomycetota bacterium]
MIRATHERPDGTGYPDKLSGTEIPLGAQIISACEAFDAMTADRPYRDSISREEALAELERCSGTQFSEQVVQALKHVVRNDPAPSSTLREVTAAATA